MIAIALVGLIVLYGLYKKITGTGVVETPLPPEGWDPGYGLSAVPSQVDRWQLQARNAASRYGLPWEIVLGQIWTESAGDPNAYGSAGEIGLMQLKKIAIQDIQQNGYGTFDDWAVNPATNVRAGAAFLDLQLRRTGDIGQALGAYNQGYRGARERPVLANRYRDKVLNKARIIGYNG